MPMGRAAAEDWPEDYIIVVPHAWRGDGLWIDMQTEAQERIGTTLREMLRRTAPAALVSSVTEPHPADRDRIGDIPV
jgi:hypothetical protein